MTKVKSPAAPTATGHTTQHRVADALTRAADELNALLYPWVTGQTTVLPILCRHAGADAEAARDAILAHLQQAGVDPAPLFKWAAPMLATEVAGWMRAAAQITTTRPAAVEPTGREPQAVGTPAPDPLRRIRVAADLEVGDWLNTGDGRDILITDLNPATREKTLAAGRREVWSLGSCRVLDADEPVKASPRIPGKAVAR
ncbi:hypothetical protein GCM10017673_39970 [Streptosporangium violaceochromogenes]|nr:hypothetical protein GCM10017673_39970 [Streptosporangium violaceochromogenes]